MSAEHAFEAAVRAALTADAAMRALVGNPARVFEAEPDQPLYPFVTLGQTQSTPKDAAASQALEHALTVHVWARHGGKSEALAVLNAAREALHDRPLAVSGRRLVYLFAVFADVFRAPDQRTTHAVLRLKALTEPA